MQWLIDIVYEKVMAAIGPHNPFVDRGDPGDYDFRVGDFNTNGAWHDLDLSGIVPAGAKAVLVFCTILDNLVGTYIQFRENGNANTHNSHTQRTQVANIYLDSTVIIALDANRKIEYRAASTVFTQLHFVVRGWWL